ncbi:hypothetical protein QF028_002317 [Neobacillus sp. B4I6]|uniref:DUF6980 family protein n=1 Tax=Neobacillus sp. B4I6 TaxID=3373925 RepID=UPI003D22C7BD
MAVPKKYKLSYQPDYIIDECLYFEDDEKVINRLKKMAMTSTLLVTSDQVREGIFDEYGIVMQEASRTSTIYIIYCPWCGTKLPNSKRRLWLESLEKLGYSNPFEQSIPKKYMSGEWYKDK